MSTRVGELWHNDQDGKNKPHLMVGERWVHVKTSHLYVVTGYSFNATYDAWDVHYDRYDEGKRFDFGFTRRMSEFLDGRFIKVE